MKRKRTGEPPLVSLDNHDQRESFRYVFPPGKALSGSFKGRPVQILNISAGGLAFVNRGFERYDADVMVLDLSVPDGHTARQFKARTRILHLAADGICHCIFENCTLDDYEIVHKYVLEMQKQDLRTK